MSFFEEIAIALADTPAITAFGRLRTADGESLFGSKLLGDLRVLDWDDAETSGSGTSTTFNTNQASASLGVSNLGAGTRVRQSKRWMNYQPGKSQLIMCTGVMGTGVAGITRRIGLFETKNGLFFELSGTTLKVVRRTYTGGSAVDNAVSQSSWNLDKMDGTGPSGITINTALTQIFVIDFEWLGVGRVRFGFNVNGVTYYCHEMLNANSLSVVYMQIPNLPVRYEISNDGTGPASTLVQICSNVSSEGGQTAVGTTFSKNRGTTALTTLNNTDMYPIIAIRRQAAYPFASVQPIAVDIVCTSTSFFNWALVLNPTIVGTALSWSAVTNSVCETATTTTNATTITGGTYLHGGTGTGTINDEMSSLQNESNMTLGRTISGAEDIIVLAAQRITGTTEPFYATLNWREEY